MGITIQHAELILKEHLYKPLPDTIHLFGRQTILFDYETALYLCRKHNFEPKTCDVELDNQTRDAIALKHECISDETFFRMLGVQSVKAIDHSDYEGAEIILDLNKPIPLEYENTIDFLFGGSVCDNVFDPAMYLRNAARLLKPGGRLLDQNIASNHYHPYAVLPPAWYFDYFVMNRFRDCKVYIFEILKYWNIYALDLEPNFKLIADFTAEREIALGLFVIAEKSPFSSWHISPSQDQYRGQEEWRIYFDNLRYILDSPRPYGTFKMPGPEESAVLPPKNIPGYRFVGRFF
jgi:SAM-dependent methyltransferase